MNLETDNNFKECSHIKYGYVGEILDYLGDLFEDEQKPLVEKRILQANFDFIFHRAGITEKERELLKYCYIIKDQYNNYHSVKQISKKTGMNEAVIVSHVDEALNKLSDYEDKLEIAILKEPVNDEQNLITNDVEKTEGLYLSSLFSKTEVQSSVDFSELDSGFQSCSEYLSILGQKVLELKKNPLKQQSLVADIKHILNHLSKKEQKALELLYGLQDGKKRTHKDISQKFTTEFGTNHSRAIKSIEEEAMRHIKIFTGYLDLLVNQGYLTKEDKMRLQSLKKR